MAALDAPRGVLRETGAIGSSSLLYALGEPHRLALRGIVHAQVVADLSDDDLSRVESDPRRERKPS